MSDAPGRLSRPVRAALLDRARADADATLEQADSDAAAVLAAARARAEALRRRGPGGRSAGRRRRPGAGSAPGRAARRGRRCCERSRRPTTDLRHRAATAVRQLRADPSYPALLDRLRGQALAELGPDATAVASIRTAASSPRRPGAGWISRCAALAERAVDDLGGQVAALWT